MTKGIYCLKIFLLRLDFKITKEEEIALGRICTFIIKNYIKWWSTVTNVSEAPLNYFNFIRSLNAYNKDVKIIAEACLSKFLNHLWYFNEKCIAFSVFDERIPLKITKNIAIKLVN